MASDFFYSKSTGLFVSRKPLIIDSRIKRAIDATNVKLSWDDEGRINNINFEDSRILLEALDSRMLSPKEYWMAYSDAITCNDAEMIDELTSNEYTEWLDRVYLPDKTYIDNPSILGGYNFAGVKNVSSYPKGRPGWFNFENNINTNTGEPITVIENREKFSTSWKYWEPSFKTTFVGKCIPIRGYVTSVGKPSLDLGIPPDAMQPKLMIRECRTMPLNPIIDAQILKDAEKLLESNNRDAIIRFLELNGQLFHGNDSTIYILREKFFDMLGDCYFDYDIGIASKKLYNKSHTTEELSYDALLKFIKNSKTRLHNSLKENTDIVFVMGHKNPDTDTVISSIFEAWRNHLMNGENVAYIPIVQSLRMPDEIDELLGELSGHIIFYNDDEYIRAKNSGLARWISVDHNNEPEVQKYFITILDHHTVCAAAKNREIPKTLEMLGSCAGIIARKFLGMNIRLDKNATKILYAATLMDTENRVTHKMTSKDELIMNYLKKVSETIDDNSLYMHLMSKLLNTDDAKLLFDRDYKEDWGFGFAVAKVKNALDKHGNLEKTDLINNLKNLGIENNQKKNLPLTIVKITDYNEDNETVNRERIYVLMQNLETEFNKTVMKILKSIINFEFCDDELLVHDEYIEFWGTGMQLSRKKTAPVIEPIVDAFNKYFYSKSIKLFVKRDFLKYTKNVKDIPDTLSSDSKSRINHITYIEAKELILKLNIKMLSISEYWRVLKDAKNCSDYNMIKSLQGSDFVEFWDSAIINKNKLIDHPNIVNGKICGTSKNITVLSGNPGLIHPETIDIITGIPTIVRPPNEYGNPELWRYWEPDSEIVIPCRSHIFLLDQPCWDGKFHLNDNFPNLGIRPVVENVDTPKITCSWNEEFLTIKIELEGDVHTYNWPKKISDFIDIE